MKRPNLVLSLSLMLFPAGFSLPAQGADLAVQTVYQTRFLGLPVSRAFLTFTLKEDGGYEIKGNGKASFLASLFKPLKAELAAKGRIKNGKTEPERFTALITGGETAYDIDLQYKGHAIGAERSLPSRTEIPDDFVPVTEAMKKGTTDPLNAFVISAGTEDICKRVLPIYTGRERFDLTFSPKGESGIALPGFYNGKAVICAVRYTPLGGHRGQKKEVLYMKDNQAIEGWFLPVPGTPLMLLYKVEIGTKLGPVTVELEKAGFTPAAAELTPVNGW